ncbi:hypothetical protein RHGRI_034452 [Rhododendron griersonianum]|uniref:Uncharacterized protein n=1 Tax=Rhododendron griersonianum TaxID=479676 RepID=A0AAV6I6P4_9ERIC|nr:hypothetical protein RHGRI_034452 [Rhododendron griersonianum]
MQTSLFLFISFYPSPDRSVPGDSVSAQFGSPARITAIIMPVTEEICLTKKEQNYGNQSTGNNKVFYQQIFPYVVFYKIHINARPRFIEIARFYQIEVEVVWLFGLLLSGGLLKAIRVRRVMSVAIIISSRLKRKKNAALPYPREDGRMIYNAYNTFMHRYAPQLILGGDLEWESEDNLGVSLDVIVHNSFMCRSIAGVGCCWYLAHIAVHHLTGLMVCFAIRLDTVYSRFRKYNLGFIKEDDLQSACFPLTLQHRIHVARFVYMCGSHRFNAKEFERRLSPTIDDLNLDNISISMGSRTWTLLCEHPSENPVFCEFIELLDLQCTNYITMLADHAQYF